MAVRRKNFSTKKKGSDDVIMLDVNQDDPEFAASFACNPKIPGMVLLDFVAVADVDEEDEEAMMALAGVLQDLFKAAVRKSDYDRFMAYCRESDNEVELDDLADWAGWLAEQYSGGNPTVPSPPSSDGSPETGPGNMEEPLDPAWTSRGSMANGSPL